MKKQITVRVDADVLAWLKSQGSGYQTRMNEILRQAMIKKVSRSGEKQGLTISDPMDLKSSCAGVQMWVHFTYHHFTLGTKHEC